ncbi:MAG: beta-CASP ribonuclease aCPSF1 [Candidatus Micrarchaeia archaeon]
MTNDKLKELRLAIEEVLPVECGLTKVEPEGPQIVIYLKNIRVFYEDESLVTRLASRVRKKVLLRVDSSMLKDPELALKEVTAMIPVEAGVQSVRFDPEFNEVVIEALKPGLVIGKGGMMLKNIILSTGWSPRVLRSPTSPSEVERALRGAILKVSKERKKFLTGLGKKMLLSPKGATDWVKITGLGGFKEVGRSCLLLQTPNSNVLIDCGINADTSDAQNAYPYLNAMNLSLDQIDAVIVTHAHLDHCGFIPYLYKFGYDGPTYCTPPTRDLMIMLQQDCINVMNSEGAGAPYGEREIKNELGHVITRNYGEVTDITPEIRFTFHNAGHILGSSIVHLHIGEGVHNLVHTGDIKFGHTNLFEPADVRYPRIETLLIESTYGGRGDIQPRLRDAEQELVALIKQTLARRGKVLIPVFSVGRAQEIMLVLERYLGSENALVYLDGMSREASAIHTVYPEYLRHNLQRRILQNNSPFENPMFKNVVSSQRKDIVERDEPCVILAPSGMLSGGPSVDFLKMMAIDERNALMFVGYQSTSSLGRRVQRGEREVPILSDGRKLASLKINLSAHTVDGFSGHSDRPQLMAFCRNLHPKPQRIITMHGDDNKPEDLAHGLNKMLHCETRAIMNLDTVRLK